MLRPRSRPMTATGLVLVAVGLAACQEGEAGPALARPDVAGLGAGLHRLELAGFDATVSVPESCAAGGGGPACGLIVEAHGASMSADKMDSETNMRQLGAQAPAHGAATPYVVVHPEAHGPGAQWQQGDERGVLALADCLIADLGLDGTRRHMAGYSLGGYMVAGTYCQAAGAYTSFAAMAGGVDVIQQCMDDTDTPTRLLYIHGRGDRMVPFAAVKAFIAEVAGDAQAAAILAQGQGRARFGALDVDIRLHDGDRPGLVGGHCLPGGSGFAGCTEGADFDVGETLLDFFIAAEADAAG
ncbi:hypothetical protein [Rhodothalassium salexigens]|uniref:hypothetical protein n=1 Tax=Rhodothalassium salexigens TaxID=1086 RepID=UPI00191368F2|nr:hypothetical protein [Rhodothalassium salexigens]